MLLRFPLDHQHSDPSRLTLNEIIAVDAIRTISTISGTQSRRVRRSYLSPLYQLRD